ncbi:hypothetical protein EYF80_022189 [Liparis tanakae]|uniref:Uncharacterized protein n=1 Tax=Liparis tanakae TaxID=230148 RepID=A0A4Z2HPU3_9TELE|nr:hypothetical protein EYF80_022189 [Liparis tanakae]
MDFIVRIEKAFSLKVGEDGVEEIEYAGAPRRAPPAWGAAGAAAAAAAAAGIATAASLRGGVAGAGTGAAAAAADPIPTDNADSGITAAVPDPQVVSVHESVNEVSVGDGGGGEAGQGSERQVGSDEGNKNK